MIHQVPPHIVQKVTDYAHRKAEFSFRVCNNGKFIEAGDFIKFKVRSWNESYLDFLDVLCDEIMRTSAYKTVGKILDGEPYHFDVIGVHNGQVSFTIYTRLGKIKINSPFESLEEALIRAVEELREVEAYDDI